MDFSNQIYRGGLRRPRRRDFGPGGACGHRLSQIVCRVVCVGCMAGMQTNMRGNVFVIERGVIRHNCATMRVPGGEVQRQCVVA